MSDIKLLKFVKSLSPRDQLFFLLMRDYMRAAEANASEEYMEENCRLYQDAILRLKSVEEIAQKHPIYESQPVRNDKAEPSISKDHKPLGIVEQMRAIDVTDKNFDDKLGEWASSLSLESDPDDPKKKDHNKSDLSSDDEK